MLTNIKPKSIFIRSILDTNAITALIFHPRLRQKHKLSTCVDNLEFSIFQVESHRLKFSHYLISEEKKIRL